MSDRTTALAHHFDDMEQQSSAVTLGMWLFLVQEVMFFGGLFLGYTVYRAQYPDAFADASHHLDVLLGGVNTVVLILSSLTMAMAVHAAQKGSRKALVTFLILTIILGSVFLGIKVVEYHHKWVENLIPGEFFSYEGAAAREAQLFFYFYFAMTGMHALHMVIGVAILAVLVWQSWRGWYSPGYYSPIEMTGLYWHFVDIVWIFLFPLLYLIGMHL